MAGIDKYLDIIKKGVFGRDVRKAIHDGIAQVYEDATFDGNTNMEVAKARGSNSTLSERLTNIDLNVLNNIADISKVDARIDNIISSTGNGMIPSELIDIRNGFDGSIYKTAGEAVRKQLGIFNGTKNLIKTNTKIEEQSGSRRAEFTSTNDGLMIIVGNAIVWDTFYWKWIDSNRPKLIAGTTYEISNFLGEPQSGVRGCIINIEDENGNVEMLNNSEKTIFTYTPPKNVYVNSWQVALTDSKSYNLVLRPSIQVKSEDNTFIGGSPTFKAIFDYFESKNKKLLNNIENQPIKLLQNSFEKGTINNSGQEEPEPTHVRCNQMNIVELGTTVYYDLPENIYIRFEFFDVLGNFVKHSSNLKKSAYFISEYPKFRYIVFNKNYDNKITISDAKKIKIYYLNINQRILENLSFSKIEPDARIIAIGDSITEGLKSYNNQKILFEKPWPKVMIELYGGSLINAAVSGRSITGNDPDDFDGQIAKHDFNNFDIAIIAMGTNDFNNQIEPEYVKERLRKGLNTIYKQNPTIRIAGILPHNIMRLPFTIPANAVRVDAYQFADKNGKTLSDMCDAIASIYDEFQIPYIDWRKSPVLTLRTYDKWTVDGIHPNQDGHNLIGRRIAEWLKINV